MPGHLHMTRTDQIVSRGPRARNGYGAYRRQAVRLSTDGRIDYRRCVAVRIRPPLPPSWTGPTQPAFVGRRQELSIFEEAWSAVLDGARQVLFVGGAPGIGKSRLLAEVATVLYRHGAMVLVGTCFAEFGLPYQPFS